MRELVVLGGSVAQKPRQAGHAWQFLQYLLGFRRLGYDVLFLDRLEPAMCADGQGRPCPVERSENLRYLAEVMEDLGLGSSWALLVEGGKTVGLPKGDVLERVRRSRVFLNVMGFITDEDVLAAAPRRVFLDTDPGVGQMWRELGLADVFADHDAYVTIAERIGEPDCPIPTCGIDWITARQPVVLDLWAPREGRRGTAFTSVGAWRGPYAPIEYEGETYGQRVHEFRRFVELPRLTDASFEMALDIQPGDEKDRALLRENGWRLADPRVVARSPGSYRDYVRSSMAELMVATGMVVKTRCGWFSERSMCYLASGRPVLAQDTGIRSLYPTGEGLIAFSTVEEAAEGVAGIAADYERHGRAAREIAAEFFASDRVLTRLLEQVDAG